MTGYLLDTHVVIWWLEDRAKLSSKARDLISDPATAIYVSAAVGWEIGIKKSIGLLETPDNMLEVLAEDRLQVLPITLEHGLAVARLPLHHRDPFDRLMIAQALAEDLVLITRDANVRRYDVAQVRA